VRTARNSTRAAPFHHVVHRFQPNPAAPRPLQRREIARPLGAEAEIPPTSSQRTPGPAPARPRRTGPRQRGQLRTKTQARASWIPASAINSSFSRSRDSRAGAAGRKKLARVRLECQDAAR
jgi:hypothetical protein